MSVWEMRTVRSLPFYFLPNFTLLRIYTFTMLLINWSKSVSDPSKRLFSLTECNILWYVIRQLDKYRSFRFSTFSTRQVRHQSGIPRHFVKRIGSKHQVEVGRYLSEVGVSSFDYKLVLSKDLVINVNGVVITSSK